LDPETKVENCHLDVGPDISSQTLDRNRSEVAVEKPVDNPIDPEMHPALDPNYPSREILLAVADKLLKLFEQR
jgi:hypothetical protein